MTSHDAVMAVRRITRIRRVGHGGTLDPNAAGVLPVALGGATRLLEWAQLTPKVYLAEIGFGVQTASGDRGAPAIGFSGPPWPNAADLAALAHHLEGVQLQFPPQVSAIKRNGQPLYRSARLGQSVWPPPRRVEIHALEIQEVVSGRLRLTAVVSAGTYIRALARDLAFMAGQAGTLNSLVRTRTGKFLLHQAVALAELERMGEGWPARLISPAAVLSIPQVAVDPAWRSWIANGRMGDWPEILGYDGDVAITVGGELAAVITGPPWRYRKVLLDSAAPT